MRLNEGCVISALMGSALRRENLTIFGVMSQTRFFCYGDDEFKGIYRFLLSDYLEPVNNGNSNEITKLAETMQKTFYKE